MRIAVFTDHFFPELGGIQDSVMLTTRSLARRGHEIELFAPRHPAADFARSGHQVGEPDLGSGVTIHRRLSLPFASSTQQSRAAVPLPSSLLALSGRRPDVIHSHSFFGLGIEALVAGRMLGVPVIGTNHTNVPGFAPYIPVPVERAMDWVVWYYNRCEAITAPSRSVFEGLGLARMKQRPHIVSNPIDLSVFQPGQPDIRAATRRRYGLSGPVILYAGRLGPEKNIETVLRAQALLPTPPQLALAGHGAHEPVLRRLAAELGVADRVVFLGTLLPAELALVFGAADLFAMMSTSETQSMASLQAMACGLPVLAPDRGALAEFVSPSTGRLVAPDDAAALATAISGLLGDPAGRVRMGEAAHRLAQRHSVEAVSDAWENLYQSLLPSGSAAWSPT